MPKVETWFGDPQLQAGLEAAVRADWQIGLAVEEEPDKVRPRLLPCVPQSGHGLRLGTA